MNKQLSDNEHNILQKLAFQRGILTLLKETKLSCPMLEKAIENIDSIIDLTG